MLLYYNLFINAIFCHNVGIIRINYSVKFIKESTLILHCLKCFEKFPVRKFCKKSENDPMGKC